MLHTGSGIFAGPAEKLITVLELIVLYFCVDVLKYSCVIKCMFIKPNKSCFKLSEDVVATAELALSEATQHSSTFI